jgi:hypothetical protein
MLLADNDVFLADSAASLSFSAQWAASASYSLASINGAYSLLDEVASAVADTSALIWRISRYSVDGCMTFSFDHGCDQMIPDFGSPQAGKSQEPSSRVRQIARASAMSRLHGLAILSARK